MINLLYKINDKCSKVLTGVHIGFLLYILIDDDYKLFNIINKRNIIFITSVSCTIYLLLK
jgi:hypothetical protein